MRKAMRIDISLLPVLAAAFMLAFARIGAMVMPIQKMQKAVAGACL